MLTRDGFFKKQKEHGCGKRGKGFREILFKNLKSTTERSIIYIKLDNHIQMYSDVFRSKSVRSIGWK